MRLKTHYANLKNKQIDVSSSHSAIPIKIVARFLVAIDKLILKFIWKGTGLSITKIILTKKNKVGGINSTLYINTLIKKLQSSDNAVLAEE